jgi:hypothetical protein
VARDQDPATVYRITGAAPSRSKDLDRRVNRYLISMGIRTLCVLLVFVVPGPTRWLFAAGAVFLPYVAVLLANAGGTRRDGGPPPVERRGLAAGHPGRPPVPESAPGSAPRPSAEARSDPPSTPGVLLGHIVDGTGPPPPEDR